MELFSHERAVWDLTDQMVDARVRSVARPGEQSDDQIEFSADHHSLPLTVWAGPEVPAQP
ncbi:hypothetical protein [Streptomyces sp. NBC_00338]|uniref:hypothetical protein n=1 Tax=Streptomyces sp. NBC_00338 TaxID=2975715 RepID=UPI002254FDCE|nr:hypothetical protein [Streptomyces sp. NBC_00338]MCX5143911.1 hypothetical protein [Streptomyces sp. NBC_00338]